MQAYCTILYLTILEPVCQYRGAELQLGETQEHNCNHCKCQVWTCTGILPGIPSLLGQVSTDKPGCMEVLCSTFQCLLEEEVMTELMEGEEESIYSWKPANFSEFWGKTLEDGINGKLGATKPDLRVTKKVS